MTSSAWKRTLAASLLAATALATSAVTGRAADITLRALMEDVPETRIIEARCPNSPKRPVSRWSSRKSLSRQHDKLVTQLVSAESAYNLLRSTFSGPASFRPPTGWSI